jgi:outer membrane murein-binding lipoprotein Lpp
MRRAFLLLIPLIAVLGCQSKKDYEKALADAQTLAAEKDSLLSEVLETSKFVTSVNEELARSKSVGGSAATAGDPGVPGPEADRAARAAALKKVQDLVVHLNEAETKLDAASARARTLSGRNKTLLTQIDDYKAQLDTLRASAERQAFELGAVIDSQKVQIASLSEERDTLTAQTSSLSAERIALNDSVARLTTTTNTVYYVVGKEDDLIKKGVVKKEGSKFLFFGGTSLQPARNLTPENFTAVDKTQELVIPMPASDKEYKVISRQNLAFADSTDLDDGKVKGGQLHIMSPDQFWAGSRYLILVED